MKNTMIIKSMHEHKEHDDHKEHAEHKEEKDSHKGHHHGEHDPHVWLDPMNAKVILKEMVKHLIENESKKCI